MPKFLKSATLKLFVMCMMPVSIVTSGLQNTFFTNLSSVTFDVATWFIVSHGLNFIPTVRPPAWTDVNQDYFKFSRRIYCHDYFSQLDEEDTREKPPSPKFRVPNPSWHPKTSGGDYIPSYGVEEYLAATLHDVRECFEESQSLHAMKPVYNLCKRHRDALCALRQRRDIIFVDADKNLGLV